MLCNVKELVFHMSGMFPIFSLLGPLRDQWQAFKQWEHEEAEGVTQGGFCADECQDEIKKQYHMSYIGFICGTHGFTYICCYYMQAYDRKRGIEFVCMDI